MRITFDRAKDGWTRERRGFGFSYAARIYAGRIVERQDTMRDYGEVRMNALGEIEGAIFHVTYTRRDEALHIISARLASRKERQAWHSSAKP